MFKPQFSLPAELDGRDSTLIASLVDLFEDLSSAVEKISENYHDDYLFKHYLQEKWNEILNSAKSEQGELPQAPAEATV
jgi:hypothetical protein